ncbi:MAG: T9SS type A sorting domain-containing protein [Bacteroidales bacterium]|nr:T9SS type A sorting domain-containing protein [Bacteroidales bacterium]
MKSNLYKSGILASLLIILFNSNLFAQWSTDPNHPGIVCNENGSEKSVKAFTDGDGGVFVFWLDGRDLSSPSIRQIFGQHYDQNGYALWESSGRPIISHSKAINLFDVKKFDNGDIIIGWVTSTPASNGLDTLLFQKLDNNGGRVWSQDLMVAAEDATITIGITGFDFLLNNEAYAVDIQVNYMGGSNGNRITYFTSNGVLTGSFNGHPMGTQYYFGSAKILPVHNGSDDIYLYYSGGNGAGAGLFCMRISTSGDTVWGPQNVLAGTTGLSYQFTAFSDPGGVVFVWVGSANGYSNIYARRIDSDGNLVWGDPPVSICAADGNQDKFFCQKLDNTYYIVWADGRPGTNPGNYDIFGQKFDEAGTVYWESDGLQIASFNTYIPYPKFTFTNDNDLIVCHQSSFVGFNAQKVKQNGDLPWAPDGTQVCIPTYNPFYQEHIELLSGNTVLAVWSGSGSNGVDGVYISKINQYLTGLPETEISSVKSYPNPASKYICLKVEDSQMQLDAIEIISASGIVYSRSMRSVQIENGTLKIAIEDLPAGRYILKYGTESGSFSTGFVKVD